MSFSISNDKPHEGLMHFLVATPCIQDVFLKSYLDFFPDDFVSHVSCSSYRFGLELEVLINFIWYYGFLRYFSYIFKSCCITPSMSSSLTAGDTACLRRLLTVVEISEL